MTSHFQDGGHDVISCSQLLQRHFAQAGAAAGEGHNTSSSAGAWQ